MDASLHAARQLLAQKAAYDLEYAAAYHILRAPLLSHNHRVWAHVDDGGVDFKAMLAQRGWSTAERLMLRAAWSLFNGDADVNLGQLLGTLSGDNRRCVVAAIATLARIRMPAAA